MIDNTRQEIIHNQVMEILKENNLAFSNVARPKPTKASTATSASWSKDMAPKASAATQGAWDSTNTPGGVSSLAKEKWNVEKIAALVTNALEALINEGNVYDEVIAIGPLVMMKFVTLLTKKYNIKTVVSMNPIMIDGTGMCGCCRLTVGGKTKFACVDGPDFDGAEVDFDEARCRGGIYLEWEKHKYEETCNLFKKEAK